jgi:hypothetical protein
MRRSLLLIPAVAALGVFTWALCVVASEEMPTPGPPKKRDAGTDAGWGDYRAKGMPLR